MTTSPTCRPWNKEVESFQATKSLTRSRLWLHLEPTNVGLWVGLVGECSITNGQPLTDDAAPLGIITLEVSASTGPGHDEAAATKVSTPAHT